MKRDCHTREPRHGGPTHLVYARHGDGYGDNIKLESSDGLVVHRTQDRRVVILEYEVPKFDGDLGTPNVYVPLTQAQLRHKCEILMECFPSQRTRAWFTPSTFEAMARIRGIECNAPEGLAEAFYGRKMVLQS